MTPPTDIPPEERIVTLYERTPAPRTTLTPALADLYDGGLDIPSNSDRPYVLANFVETLDGVTTFGISGQSGGGPISGESAADRRLMGLLRARADAVLTGSASLREDAGHVRVPAFVAPDLAEEYAALRRHLGLADALPLNVVITARGDLPLGEPTFRYPGLRVVVATTPAGADALRAAAHDALPPSVDVLPLAPDADGAVPPAALLRELAERYGVRVALHEGGPRAFAAFLAAGCLDELFLTFAPHVAGRDADAPRRGLVEGHAFAPGATPWADLLSVKRAGGHLLFRYRFPRADG